MKLMRSSTRSLQRVPSPGSFLGRRDGERGHCSLAGGISRHARTRAPFECRPGRYIDYASALRRCLHALDRRGAAEERGDEIDPDLLHQFRLAGFGNIAHGKAAGEMDGCPELRHLRIELRNGALVQKVSIGNEIYARMLA